MEDFTLNSAIKYYPNPVQNELTVELIQNVESLTIAIYSMNGQLIQNTSYVQTDEVKVNMRDLAPGTYIMEVKYNSDVLRTRIIKR